MPSSRKTDEMTVSVNLHLRLNSAGEAKTNITAALHRNRCGFVNRKTTAPMNERRLSISLTNATDSAEISTAAAG